MHCFRLSVVCGIAGAIVVHTGATEPHRWLAPVSGDWDDPAQWEPGDIPTIGDVPNVSNECAVFGFMTAYTVTSGAQVTHGGIQITNPSAQLVLSATHFVFGPIENDGSIRLDPGGVLDLGFADRRIDGLGAITLGAASSLTSARIDADDALLTHGVGHTINGNGSIENTSNGGRWLNEGVIVADDPAGLGIAMDADLEQTVGGRIGADAGSLLLQNGSRITGGTLFSENGGKVRVDGPYVLTGIVATLDGVRIEGRVDVEDSYKVLAIAGSINNQGEIVVNGNLDADDAEVRFDADASILGGGEVILRSGVSKTARMTAASGVEGVVGPNMTVRGAGVIEGHADFSGAGGFVNNGLVIADDPAQAMSLLGDHAGTGLYGADDATMIFGDLVRMVGCRMNTLGAGRFLVGQRATLVGGENRGVMEIGPDGALSISGTLVNDGVITTVGASFVEPILLADGAVVSGDGSFEFDSAFEGIEVLSSGSATIGVGQRILGKCFIEGALIVEGVFEPDGSIDVLGDITLLPTAVTRMQVGDRTSISEDRLDTEFQGTIQLAGTLVVEVDDGYVPLAGDSWNVVRGEPGIELFGAFDSIVLPEPPAGLAYAVSTDTLGIFVSVEEGCLGDLSEPFGTLDFSDVIAFLSAFGAMEAAADLALPTGVFDFSDIVAFLGAFGAGCP